MAKEKKEPSPNLGWVIKLGKFAIVLGGTPDEKNYSFKIQFHWDYHEPEESED